MRRLLVGTVMLASAGAALAAAPVLSATGYGPVTFGDRLEVVEKRLGEQAPPPSEGDEEHCREFDFKTYPGLFFMVENGVVTRVASSRAVPTAIGPTVGASLKSVRRAVPAIAVSPDPYDDRGHHLTLKTADGKAALLLEETAGKVTAVRGGLVPSVLYWEGCQ
jgi:hypothetical protein